MRTEWCHAHVVLLELYGYLKCDVTLMLVFFSVGCDFVPATPSLVPTLGTRLIVDATLLLCEVMSYFS